MSGSETHWDRKNDLKKIMTKKFPHLMNNIDTDNRRNSPNHKQVSTKEVTWTECDHIAENIHKTDKSRSSQR